MTTSKTRISTYIDADLKEKLDVIAKSQKRSLSNLLEVLCQNAVDKPEKK